MADTELILTARFFLPRLLCLPSHPESPNQHSTPGPKHGGKQGTRRLCVPGHESCEVILHAGIPHASFTDPYSRRAHHGAEADHFG
jgi:hypothetical protein